MKILSGTFPCGVDYGECGGIAARASLATQVSRWSDLNFESAQHTQSLRLGPSAC